MKESKCCEACGAKIVEYTFTFNDGLARCLSRMQGHKKPVEIKTLGLTTSMWTNFQKLRYWGLIEKGFEFDRKGGWWKITELGERFLAGRARIYQKVVMYRNQIESYEGSPIYFKDVDAGYEYRGDYKDQVINQ